MKLLMLLVSLCASITAYGSESAVRKAAKRVGISAKLLLAICFKESKLTGKAFRANDGGPDRHAYGICQVHMSTALWLGMKDDDGCVDNDFSLIENRTKRLCPLFDPYTNAYWAAKYLKYQLDRYGNHDKAVAAYNAGTAFICETGSTRSGKKCTIGQFVNQKYVDDVMEKYYGYIDTFLASQNTEYGQ